MKKLTKGEQVFKIFNVIFLSVLSICTLYPLLYVLFASISDAGILMQHDGLLLSPVGKITFGAYKAVFKNPNILTGYKNTLIILFIGVPIQIVLTSLGAYFFSRKNVMWKDLFMILIIITMFFDGGMIPFYLLNKNLGLTKSLSSLIIPFLVSAYNLIIMRTSFAAVPYSLEESANIDGANHWTILFKIYMPLSKAVIAVMLLYYGVAMWNGWFWASIFLSGKRELFPLQLILREILLMNDTNSMTVNVSAIDEEQISETIKYATTIVATVPILCIYPFVQKYFVKGVMIGSVKG